MITANCVNIVYNCNINKLIKDNCMSLPSFAFEKMISYFLWKHSCEYIVRECIDYFSTIVGTRTSSSSSMLIGAYPIWLLWLSLPPLNIYIWWWEALYQIVYAYASLDAPRSLSSSVLALSQQLLVENIFIFLHFHLCFW